MKGPPLIRSPLIRTSEPRDIHPLQNLDRKSISWIHRKEGWKHVGFMRIFTKEMVLQKKSCMILNHDFGGILTSFWVSFYFGSLPTLLKPLTYHRLKIDGWKRSFISMGQNMVPLRGPIILLSFSGVVISLPEKNQPVFFFPCGKKAFKKPRCLARGKHGHVFMFIFFSGHVVFVQHVFVKGRFYSIDPRWCWREISSEGSDKNSRI